MQDLHRDGAWTLQCIGRNQEAAVAITVHTTLSGFASLWVYEFPELGQGRLDTLHGHPSAHTEHTTAGSVYGYVRTAVRFMAAYGPRIWSVHGHDLQGAAVGVTGCVKL